jgi:hypothetical protein
LLNRIMVGEQCLQRLRQGDRLPRTPPLVVCAKRRPCSPMTQP